MVLHDRAFCLAVCMCVMLSCCGQTDCAAQDIMPPLNPVPLRPAIVKPDEQIAPKLPAGPFSFEVFMRLVESNFPKILSADAERRIAAAKRLEKEGAFDPVLTHVSEYLRLQDTVNPGKAKDAIHNEARVDLLTRSGIKLFTGMRLNPNDTKTPFLPTGKSGEYYAGLSVPLFRGLMINEKSAAEQQARLGEPLAEHVFRSFRLEIMLKAAASYWEWAGAKARLEVTRNLLNIANDRLNQIAGRVDHGDLPALDITEAEQEIQRRQAGYVKAERDLQKASLSLSIFLWDESGNPLKVPAAADASLQPQPDRLTEEQWMEGRKLALQLRPELKRIYFEREQAKVDLRLAENLMLPAMDAYLTQGADTGPDGIGPVMRGGVAMSVPLRRRTAMGLTQAARLKIQKLNLDEKAEKLRIQTEVDDTVSAVNTAYERFKATEVEVRKAEDVENGERLRFAAGDSTLFVVNLRERNTAEARMRLVEAHVDYLQALFAFRTVTCRI